MDITTVFTSSELLVLGEILSESATVVSDVANYTDTEALITRLSEYVYAEGEEAGL